MTHVIFRVLCVTLFVGAGWYFEGPIGLAMAAPVVGIACSKPLIELAEELVRWLRLRAYRGDERVYRFGRRDVRMFLWHGRPWFSARAVCSALGYEDVDVTIRHLGATRHESAGRCSEPYLSEFAVAKLGARSRHPEAIAFRIWFERDVMYPLHRARARVALG